jgi:hypothetical protein
VADQTSGIELMRRRMERATRRPPPPRRAAAGTPAAPAEAGPEGAAAGAPEAAGRAGPASVRRSRPSRAAASTTARLAPDLPAANLAIRVRKPLDDRLADLIHALRREGVRTSKVELIEMLLWELPEDDAAAARERLRRFRAVAPRGPGAPLEEG